MPRTIELNIGLHVAGQDNTPARRDARAVRALAELALRGATVLRQRREVATYQDQAGETRVEETLVVELLDEAWLRRKPSPFYPISEACGQDCIAVYWPHVNTGELVGPRTQGYGAFDLQYFIRFDRVATATAA